MQARKMTTERIMALPSAGSSNSLLTALCAGMVRKHLVTTLHVRRLGLICETVLSFLKGL